MCDRYETCRPGGTDVTPETFWDVYELADDDQGDDQAGDDQGDDQAEAVNRTDVTKEQWDWWNTRGRA